MTWRSEFRSAKWSGGLAQWETKGTVFLSVVFSWRVDEARSRAIFARAQGKRVVAGGPALSHAKLRRVIEEVAEVGNHYPDAIAYHNPLATVASRGCPVGCWFCIVPAMEGRTFSMLPDFPVRPILCDNNLSALPVDYQDHIVARYRREGVPLLDANSGFEPATFDEEVYHRWKEINRGPWRFAFDEERERKDVVRVLRMLRDEPSWKKRIYVLIGNEPIADCMTRINEVIRLGGQPHVQPYIKLTAREKRHNVRFDWTERKLRDVARWANRRIWKYSTFEDYDTSVRTKKGKPCDGQLTLSGGLS